MCKESFIYNEKNFVLRFHKKKSKSCYSETKSNDVFSYFPSMLEDLKSSLMTLKGGERVNYKGVYDLHWSGKSQSSINYLNSYVSKASVIKAIHF